MKTIKQTYHIDSSISNVWRALTEAKEIDIWGGGPATMIDKVGEKFSLWGGSIWGKNTEVTKEKRLVQEWWSDSENEKWKKPTIAIFELQQEKDGVTINLTHKGVPDADAKSIDDGWKKFYLGPMKENLENK